MEVFCLTVMEARSLRLGGQQGLFLLRAERNLKAVPGLLLASRGQVESSVMLNLSPSLHVPRVPPLCICFEIYPLFF